MPPVADLRVELDELCARAGREVRVMEVCGTHTVAIFRSGLRSMLPGNLRLISGPGCPVCVTAQRHIDTAIDLAARPGVIVATYGDMMGVPGRQGSLERQRARGAVVRVVYSVRQAVKLARANPGREVVFIGVGFETTAPAAAAAIRQARDEGIDNFSVLSAHKLVVPAMMALLADGEAVLDGFLCPGHVSVIIGADAYRPVVERHGVGCVIAGFEPGQILAGLVRLVGQITMGQARLENVYTAAVKPEGNPRALSLIDEVFSIGEAPWRAMGSIPRSGLDIRPEYERHDALRRFGMVLGQDHDPPDCRCAQVIQGKVLPRECPLFGRTCTPRSPVGPCMVSSEGSCAAWFKYGSAAGETAPA